MKLDDKSQFLSDDACWEFEPSSVFQHRSNPLNRYLQCLFRPSIQLNSKSSENREEKIITMMIGKGHGDLKTRFSLTKTLKLTSHWRKLFSFKFPKWKIILVHSSDLGFIFTSTTWQLVYPRRIGRTSFVKRANDKAFTNKCPSGKSRQRKHFKGNSFFLVFISTSR